MTNICQKLFTTGVLGIIAQNALAKNEDNLCFYRAPMTGHKCALGQSISDEVYTPDMEQATPMLHPPLNDDIRATVARVMGLETAEDCAFARAFQRVHDNAPTVTDFIARARTFANMEGLEFPDVP